VPGLGEETANLTTPTAARSVPRSVRSAPMSARHCGNRPCQTLSEEKLSPDRGVGFSLKIEFFACVRAWQPLWWFLRRKCVSDVGHEVRRMKSLPHWMGHKWLGAIAALLAVCLIPSPAQADCGDYVAMHGKNLYLVFEHGHASLAHDVQSRTNDTSPCSGPWCSRRSAPLSVPQAPASLGSEQSEQWASLATLPGICLRDTGQHQHEEPSLTLVRRSTDLYRPPR
jgi:hypothetical protein